jgi:hypothetical protein
LRFRLTFGDCRIFENDASFTNVTQPSLRIALEAATQQLTNRWRCVRNDRFVLHHRGHGLGDRLASKELTASDHLGEDHAEGPDVGATIDGPSLRLFR